MPQVGGQRFCLRMNDIYQSRMGDDLELQNPPSSVRYKYVRLGGPERLSITRDDDGQSACTAALHSYHNCDALRPLRQTRTTPKRLTSSDRDSVLTDIRLTGPVASTNLQHQDPSIILSGHHSSPGRRRRAEMWVV